LKIDITLLLTKKQY